MKILPIYNVGQKSCTSSAFDTIEFQTGDRSLIVENSIAEARKPHYFVTFRSTECHEIWHYDDQKYIQTLEGLTALCPSCHQVKHIGLAGLKGQGKKAEARLAKVNDWSLLQTDAYLQTSN